MYVLYPSILYTCACEYVHIHVCIYTYVYIHIHTHTHYKHICVRICMYVYFQVQSAKTSPLQPHFSSSHTRTHPSANPAGTFTPQRIHLSSQQVTGDSVRGGSVRGRSWGQVTRQDGRGAVGIANLHSASHRSEALRLLLEAQEAGGLREVGAPGGGGVLQASGW